MMCDVPLNSLVFLCIEQKLFEENYQEKGNAKNVLVGAFGRAIRESARQSDESGRLS